MSNPRVSVLVPSYEYARFLPEAIDSVLAQDFDDFELIIADDASSDDTESVCRAYAERDSRVRFVRHEKNLGMVENWNWCLREARGEYVKYLLADDRLNHPSALRRMTDVLDAHPEVSLVASSRLIIDERSVPLRLKNELGQKDRVFTRDQLLHRCFSLEGHCNLIGEPTAVFFRRAQAERGFDGLYRQLVDMEMWFHLMGCGRLYYMADPLCCFRRHPAQQTEVNRRKMTCLQESLNLFTAYSGREDKSVLFRQIRTLRKKLGAWNETVVQLKRRFTPGEYMVEYLRYRLLRPIFNLRRSVRSRILSSRIGLDALCWNPKIWKRTVGQ